MLHNVTDKTKELNVICKKYDVQRLFVFGSVLTPEFNDSSDIDFSVEFKNEDIDNLFHNYCDLRNDLGLLFKRKIDLIDERGVKNPVFRKELDRTRKLVYGLA